MSRTFRKPLIAALACAVLVCAQGWIAAASAADWPTWPRPKASSPTPPEAPAPAPGTPAAETAVPQAAAPEAAPASGAAKAGETAGKKTAGGIKAGTIGWIALITAGVAGGAIAIFSGGKSSSNH